VERLLSFQVNRAHIAAALDHLSAKLLASPPINPLLQHVGDAAAPDCPRTPAAMGLILSPASRASAGVAAGPPATRIFTWPALRRK